VSPEEIGTMDMGRSSTNGFKCSSIVALTESY
jgi:hypothetical protein